MKIAFVTNFCPHYRVRTFELLAKHFDVDFMFFSPGSEWYWSRGLGVRAGNFRHEYLPGFRLGRTRITPGLLSRLLGRPYDVYIKCINGRFALSATYWAARQRRKPFVLWTGLWTPLGGLAHRLARPVTIGLYRRSDAIVAYGEHVRTYLAHLGVSDDRIFVAPHAVDNDLYSRRVPDEEKTALRRHLGLDPQDRVILYVGRLERIKGLDFLLEAFDMLGIPGVSLVLVGDGGEGDRLHRMAASLRSGSRIRFVGEVSPEGAVPFFALADALVLPSVTMPTGRELWGLVVNEAFNQGLPAIVTESVGAAAGGLVRDDYNGYVVPERDSRSLADRLRRLLTVPGLRARLGQAARESILAWDNKRMVDSFRRAIEFVTRPSAIDTRGREQVVMRHQEE